MRANYNNLTRGIYATTEFLELFFENLLLETEHELKNRYLVIDSVNEFQSAKSVDSKCQNGTLNCTLEELSVLKILKENPTITQKELAAHIEKSERTIKRITVSLQEKGIVKREKKWEMGGSIVCNLTLGKWEI